MEKVRIGILGCGNVSHEYVEAAQGSYARQMEIVSVADIKADAARELANKYGIPRAVTPDELLADPQVEVVVNLTIPKVHYETNCACLEAGKHIYCEKPFVLDMSEGYDVLRRGQEKGLRVGCAPDTFMSATVQTARKFIVDGWIGEIIGTSATMFSTTHGNENWHPSPEFFYKPGAGPLYDMGGYFVNPMIQLCGPIRDVFSMNTITFPQRKIVTEPLYGRMIDVEVPTHLVSVFHYASGAIGQMTFSWDAWNHRQPDLEIYGTEGTLSLGFPGWYNEPILMCRHSYGKDKWDSIPLMDEMRVNARGIGLADMCCAIREGRPHRANGELALHTFEFFQAIEKSGKTNELVRLETTCDIPVERWR